MTIHVESLECGGWKLSQLDKVTVIFGKNGCGKSQLLRKFRDASPTGRHYVSPERGGDIAADISQATQQSDGKARAQQRKQNTAPQFFNESIARIMALMLKRGKMRSANVPVVHEDIERAMATLLPEFQFEIEAGANELE